MGCQNRLCVLMLGRRLIIDKHYYYFSMVNMNSHNNNTRMCNLKKRNNVKDSNQMLFPLRKLETSSDYHLQHMLSYFPRS